MRAGLSGAFHHPRRAVWALSSLEVDWPATVSIGKRIINLAKSELNSLLERAARIGDDDDELEGRDPDGMGEPPPPAAGAGERSRQRPAATPTPPRGRPVRLEELSDAELEAEIERRKLDREIDERSRRASAQSQARRAYGGGSTGTTGTYGRPASVANDPVAKAYAALEVAPGADFDTVRKAYRNMMRKYHPDRHAGSPEKQKAANELAQKLSESYRLLEKRLRVK